MDVNLILIACRCLCEHSKSFILSSLGFTSVAFVAGALAWWAPVYMFRSIVIDDLQASQSKYVTTLLLGWCFLIIHWIAYILLQHVTNIEPTRLRLFYTFTSRIKYVYRVLLKSRFFFYRVALIFWFIIYILTLILGFIVYRVLLILWFVVYIESLIFCFIVNRLVSLIFRFMVYMVSRTFVFIVYIQCALLIVA